MGIRSAGSGRQEFFAGLLLVEVVPAVAETISWAEIKEGGRGNVDALADEEDEEEGSFRPRPKAEGKSE